MTTSGQKPRITVHISRTTPTAEQEPAASPSISSCGLGHSASTRFRRFAAWTSATAGSPWAFICAVILLLLWACSYPLFLGTKNPFDTWQLVVNTGTTIITFLMVFLIQNSQNRDGKAIQLKLDELIRAHKSARNHLVELENCSDEELAELKQEFERIHQAANGNRQFPNDEATNPPATNGNQPSQRR